MTNTADTKHQSNIAGILRRLCALIYDVFLISAIWFVVAGITVIINNGEAMPVWLNQVFLAPLLVICTFAFYFWFWTHGGQTLGMRAWRIQIISQTQTVPTFTQCIKRFVVAVGSLGLGFLLVLIRNDNCALQDSLSNTLIVVLPKKHY